MPDKIEDKQESIDNRLRDRLSPYEWKLVKDRMRLTSLSTFKSKFKNQLLTFITGAFTFVAALLWNDAIRSYFEKYEDNLISLVPVKEHWFVQLIAAFIMTIIAVFAILILTRVLKDKEE